MRRKGYASLITMYANVENCSKDGEKKKKHKPQIQNVLMFWCVGSKVRLWSCSPTWTRARSRPSESPVKTPPGSDLKRAPYASTGRRWRQKWRPTRWKRWDLLVRNRWVSAEEDDSGMSYVYLSLCNIYILKKDCFQVFLLLNISFYLSTSNRLIKII